jgi:hypothetical protein
MTNEQAIKWLKEALKTTDLQYEQMEKAVEMAIQALEQEPTDNVSRGVFEQVKWERDIAIEQLNELGYELGQKIEPCDAVSRGAFEQVMYERDIAIEQLHELGYEWGQKIEPYDAISRWIPVSERLPEEDGCYLVTTTGTNNNIIDIAYYTEGIWHKASKIKAWMPLPKPYEPQESEDKE